MQTPEVQIVTDIIYRKMQSLVLERSILTDSIGQIYTNESDIMRKIHDNQVAYATLLDLIAAIKSL